MKLAGFLIMAGFFFGILFVGLFAYGLYIDYQYEKSVGAYFDNAEDCINPECILEQVRAGRQAMVDEGLTPDLYGAWIFRKPSNSMKFQYTHIDSIIERAEAIQQWKIQVYSNDSSGEVLGDVYTQKMDNLRKYVTGETAGESGSRSDWIAKDAWYLKYHFFLANFGFIFGVILLLLALILIGGGMNSL